MIVVTDVHTQIEIGASTSRVWSVLSAFDRYPDWNPWIRAIDGELVAGAELRLELSTPDRGPALVTAKVERVVPVCTAAFRLECSEFSGRVTHHEYRLEPVTTGAVLHQTHRLLDPGAGPPDPIDDRTALAMDMMSAALRARAER